MLYNLIISPIETIVEWSFLFITDKLPFIGILGAIIGVSLFINFLALPLYNIADSIKEKENILQKKLEKQVDRIKKCFKGDERFMMLQTCYRQNHYHPFYSLRSSLSILIEIPFFIAAYHYLSHNEILQASNLNLVFTNLNLGAPDHILKLGPVYLNILPVLMTLINVVSGYIYAKDAPRKEKVQLFGLSAIFLVLLYESPSGLVIYWICNNLFSLAKNVLQKKTYALKLIYCLFAVLLSLFSIAIIFKHNVKPQIILLCWFITAAFISSPFIYKKLKALPAIKKLFSQELYDESYLALFLSCALAIGLLLGLVLPASVIATSPIEFSCLGKTDNPISYVFSSLYFFLGLFVIWPFAIFKMFGKKVRFWITALFFAILIAVISNIFVFKFNYGNISQTFAFESAIILENHNILFLLIPALIFIAAILLFPLFKNSKIRNAASTFIFSICIAEAALGIYKSNFILAKFDSVKESLLAAKQDGKPKELKPVYSLSKTEKNVVVIFLDRGINEFIPKTLELYPELKNSFEGFTWYENSLSYGNYTTIGAPAMLGGYEYTPEKINERKTELLRDKHNKATLVMPKLFQDAGWTVTITDPPLPNYSEKTDLSAFKAYPEMNVSELSGRYSANLIASQDKQNRQLDVICRKQCRNFSIIQALFPSARLYFYNIVKDSVNETSFEHNYSSLYFLPELTDFNSNKNNFFFIENDATHPDSDSPEWGENCDIDENDIRKVYAYQNSTDLVHFRVNALCLKAIGKWFDYLKENGVYDNTRIIIVSDHGRGINLERFQNFKAPEAPAFFSAMLLVKDFNERGPVKTDDSFMMNADTLFLAKEGLGLSDKNPFTGKTFVQEKSGSQNVYFALTWGTTKIYNEKQLPLDKNMAFSVKDNIFDEKNWTLLSK